jgi:hypothetical protein
LLEIKEHEEEIKKVESMGVPRPHTKKCLPNVTSAQFQALSDSPKPETSKDVILKKIKIKI